MDLVIYQRRLVVLETKDNDLKWCDLLPRLDSGENVLSICMFNETEFLYLNDNELKALEKKEVRI